MRENQNSLSIDNRVSHDTDSLLSDRRHPDETCMPGLAMIGEVEATTLGADKGYDARDFVAELREINVTPHLAQNTSGRRSAIDGRTTRYAGYEVSQRIRKRIEEAFAWAKTVAGLRKARHRGLPKIYWQFTLAMAAYNLVRLPKLLEHPA